MELRTNRLYTATESGRFLWSTLGESTPEEVVVYDQVSATTLGMNAMAREAHEALLLRAAGLSLLELALALNLITPDEARQVSTGSPEVPEDVTEALQSLAALLHTMESVGMVTIQTITPTF